MSAVRRWFRSIRTRERWPERDLICPSCGSTIPAFHPSDPALRRRGLYLPDFDVTCSRCGWHGDVRELEHRTTPPD